MNKEIYDVMQFLLGEGKLKGCGFGEQPEGERGNFWWRKHLRKALSEPVKQSQLADASLEPMARDGWSDEIMRQWDYYRSQIANGDKSSEPRDWFESLASVQPMKQEPVAIGNEWKPCMKLPIVVHVREQREGETHVSTREGITPILPTDLIMRGVAGEEYPIGYELFNKTYTFEIATPVHAEAIRAEALEEAEEIAKTIGGSFAEEFLAAIRGLK